MEEVAPPSVARPRFQFFFFSQTSSKKCFFVSTEYFRFLFLSSRHKLFLAPSPVPDCPPNLRDRWSSRPVATAAENRLSFRCNQHNRFAAPSNCRSNRDV